MIFLLALIDLLCVLTLVMLLVGYPLYHLQAGAALLLMMKGLFFISDVLSILDILAGILVFVLLWWYSQNLAIGITVYLAVKGAYSLV